MVLHSTEVQSVGQGLVVGQSLGGRAPVHIWRGGRMQAETHSAVRKCVYGSADPCGVKGMEKASHVCVAACQTECAHRCVCRAAGPAVCLKRCKGSVLGVEELYSSVSARNTICKYNLLDSVCFSLLVTLS